MRKLPVGWEWRPFATVATVMSNLVDPLDFADMPHVAPNHIESRTGRLLPHTTVAADGVTSAKHLFQPGQILYSKIRPYLAKAVLVDFSGLCSADMYPIVTQLRSKYLLYWMLSPEFTEIAAQHQGRSVLPKINREALAQLPVPVPPTDDQDRIIAAIEEYLSRLDEATEELEHVRRRLQALNESVVEAAVSGLLSSQRSTDETASVLISRILSGRSPEVSLGDLSPLPSGWTYATLGELAAPEPNAITDGPFGSNLKTSHYTSSGPRVIRLQNIGNGKFQDAEAHISEDHYEKLLKHSVRAGDLVIAALGTELPRACLVPSHVLPAIVKADCIRFRAHPSLSAAYLSIALNARSTRKRTASLVHGVGRPRLNLGEIKGIVLPVPPMAEQARLVSAVDQYVSALERLSVSVCASLVRASVLRRGILDSAFKGLLVPPNPTYSPIIDLVISAAGSAR